MVRRTQEEIDAGFPLEAKKEGLSFEAWKNGNKEEEEEEGEEESTTFVKRTSQEIDAGLELEWKKAGMGLEHIEAGMTFEDFQAYDGDIAAYQEAKTKAQKVALDVEDEVPDPREAYAALNEKNLRELIEDIVCNLQYDSINLSSSEMSIKKMKELGEKGYKYLFENHGKYYFQKALTKKEYEEIKRKRKELTAKTRRRGL